MSISFKDVSFISFDIWKTLLQSNPNFKQKRLAIMAGRLGYADMENFTKVVNEVDDYLDGETDKSGKDFDLALRFREIGSRLNIETPSQGEPFYDQLQEEINTVFAQIPPSFTEADLPQTLAGLHDMGLCLGLLSNTGFISGKGMRRVIEDLGILSFFDIQIFSNEIGFAKPSKGIFEIFAGKSHVPPGNVLHVGDNVKADYEGAKNSGCQAVLYDPKNKRPEGYTAISSLRELLSCVAVKQ